jgi:hypothetical protein
MGKDRRDNHEGAFGLSSEHKPDGCAYKYASSCNRQQRHEQRKSCSPCKGCKSGHGCYVSNDRQKALNLLLRVQAPTREGLAQKRVAIEFPSGLCVGLWGKVNRECPGQSVYLAADKLDL